MARLGGLARALKLTKLERQAIARKAGKASKGCKKPRAKTSPLGIENPLGEGKTRSRASIEAAGPYAREGCSSQYPLIHRHEALDPPIAAHGSRLIWDGMRSVTSL